MSYQRERDEFIATMAREGMPDHVTRQLLAKAATLQRLAVAQCNGDYPYDNGNRDLIVTACRQCGERWVFQVIKKGLCPDCRTSAQVKALVGTVPGFGVQLGGDPRGFVVLVTVPSGKTSDWGQRGIGVPTRG